MIYFDSAGSYRTLESVKKILCSSYEADFANPSSSHILGEKLSSDIESARSNIAESIGCYSSEVLFTSGATESNNIAFKRITNTQSRFHIITTAIEHKCILAISHFMKMQGHEVSIIKPDKYGVINVESVKKAVQHNTKLVSVMHVNNELGTINPIKEIGKFCYENNLLFHTDAAQSFGKIQIDVDEYNIDMMSLSAHKIGGPKGIGALYVRDLRSSDIEPIIHGAGQEFGLRGGTLPTPLIKGFDKAICDFPKIYSNKDFSLLCNNLFSLLNRYKIKFIVNGKLKLSSISSITFLNIDIPLFMRETKGQFALSQGSACSSKELEASHVLSAVGFSRKLADNTLRVSFDHLTQETDINKLVKTLSKYKI
jgi:cysteine desulfurase